LLTAGNSFQGHTTCISEAQKYEKSLYREKKPRVQRNGEQKEPPKVVAKASEEPPKEEFKKITEKPTDRNSRLDLSASVPKGKSLRLAKVLKCMQKKDNLGKKELLKKLKVTHNANGTITLSI
jgi:cell growth-regulating nucleolar protein